MRVVAAFCFFFALSPVLANMNQTIDFPARTFTKLGARSGLKGWEQRIINKKWLSRQTAVVILDMVTSIHAETQVEMHCMTPFMFAVEWTLVR